MSSKTEYYKLKVEIMAERLYLIAIDCTGVPKKWPNVLVHNWTSVMGTDVSARGFLFNRMTIITRKTL